MSEYAEKVIAQLGISQGIASDEALVVLGKESIQLMQNPGGYVEGATVRLDGPQDADAVRRFVYEVLGEL